MGYTSKWAGPIPLSPTYTMLMCGDRHGGKCNTGSIAAHQHCIWGGWGTGAQLSEWGPLGTDGCFLCRPVCVCKCACGYDTRAKFGDVLRYVRLVPSVSSSVRRHNVDDGANHQVTSQHDCIFRQGAWSRDRRAGTLGGEGWVFF